MIRTWIITARGRDKIKPNGPKMNVNPNCEISVIYVDEDLRIVRDMHGALFFYIRPSIPLLDQTKI